MLAALRARPAARVFRRSANTSAHTPAVTESPPKLPPALADYQPTSADFEEDPQLAGLEYPRLHLEHRRNRRPLGWWDNQERVNYNEPLDENDDVLSMWGPAPPKIPPSEAFKRLAVAFTGIGIVSYVVTKVAPPPRWAPKAYPRDGLAQDLGNGQSKATTPEQVAQMYFPDADTDEDT